jgi:hypothetical protein
MAAEAMMAIGGLVISTLRLHQQSCLPQNTEQSIAANFHFFLLKAGIQHVVQFASTYTCGNFAGKFFS